MSPFFAKFVSRFHILNTQESSCAMTPYFVFWVAPELQCFHARHLMPWYLVISQTQYMRIWLQSLLFCSELLLDCIHARLFEIQYLSNVCNFTHRILENLIAVNPVLFQVASKLQCFHRPSEIQYPSNSCVFTFQMLENLIAIDTVLFQVAPQLQSTLFVPSFSWIGFLIQIV